MPSLPIKGFKGNLSYKAATKFVKEKKSDGYKAFLEYDHASGLEKRYQVIWY